MPRKYNQIKSIRVIGPSIAYIPLTKGMYSLIDADDAAYLEQWRWMAREQSLAPGVVYARRYEKIDGKQVWTSIHSQLMNPPEGHMVDHKLGVTLDNRRSQLRVASQQQNTFNQRIRSTNKSGHKGVSWCSIMDKWRACIVFNGKQSVLGYFTRKEEASEAYTAAAALRFGDFAFKR